MQVRNTNTNDIIKLLAAEEEKANIAEALKAELIELLYDKLELRFQHRLAPLLRRMAINHLATGETNYAQGFRTNFLMNDEPGALAAFLDTQAKNKVWGTEVEAGALADLFDLTVMITPVTNNAKQSSLIARKSENKERPVIHLYNRNNVHWYIYDGDSDATDGNGNCLYNSIAQFLRQLLIREMGDLNNSNDNLSYVPRTEYERIIKEQDALLATIKKSAPTPMKELIKLIKKSINPVEEKDHQCAIGIAQNPDCQKTLATVPSTSSPVSSVPASTSSAVSSVQTSTSLPVSSVPSTSSPVSPLIRDDQKNTRSSNNTNIYIAAAVGLVVGSVLAALAIFVLPITVVLSTGAIVGIIAASAVANAGLFAGAVVAKQAYHTRKLRQSTDAAAQKIPTLPNQIGSTGSVISKAVPLVPTVEVSSLSAQSPGISIEHAAVDKQLQNLNSGASLTPNRL